MLMKLSHEFVSKPKTHHNNQRNNRFNNRQQQVHDTEPEPEPTHSNERRLLPVHEIQRQMNMLRSSGNHYGHGLWESYLNAVLRYNPINPRTPVPLIPNLMRYQDRFTQKEYNRPNMYQSVRF